MTGLLRRVTLGLDMTYRAVVSDGRVFALRVSSGIPIRNKSAFHTEASWMHSLVANSWCRVPEPQLTRENDFVGEVKDTTGQARASMLIEWIPGRKSKRRVTKSHA